MKLFDIVGGKVVIHSDALGIPCFKKVWDADKADKEHATKVISYIVLKNKWNSPYVLSMDPDSIEPKLKEELFDDVNYEVSAAEVACEEQFKEFCNTRLLRMLQNMRRKLDSFSDYYEESLGEDLDEKKIEKYLAGFEKVKGAYVTLDFLEKAVKTEELSTSKIKGDAKVNPYELTR